MIFELAMIIFSLRTSSVTASVRMPYCETKQTCDAIWEAPNVSDCIHKACTCTGGAEYEESRQTCKCRDGHVIGHTGCLPAAKGLGFSCVEDIQCTTLGEPVVCDAGKCGCRGDALFINGTCCKKKHPFEYCTFDKECGHIAKLVCLANKCVCEEGHFLSSNKTTCLLRLSSLLDVCEDDIQCSESFGDGSHCRDKCICKDGFHEVSNTKCVSYRKKGEECLSNPDCYIDLTCVEGKCFRRTEKTTEQAAIEKDKKDDGALDMAPPTFLILSAILLSLNVHLCG